MVSREIDWFTRRRGDTSTAASGLENRQEWRNGLLHTLAADGTLGTDTGAVLTGTAVDDGVNGDLERVLVGHDVDLCDRRLVAETFE
jgi:hypothetical protein